MYRNFFVLGGLRISAIHTVGLAGLKSRIFYLVQLVAIDCLVIHHVKNKQ